MSKRRASMGGFIAMDWLWMVAIPRYTPACFWPGARFWHRVKRVMLLFPPVGRSRTPRPWGWS